jgi:hypothetical protein
MSYVQNFHKAHADATSQKAKDWLLIKAVFRETFVNLLKALYSLVCYPFVAIFIGVIDVIKGLYSIMYCWPIAVWEGGLSNVIMAVKALRHIGTDTLPVNQKK